MVDHNEYEYTEKYVEVGDLKEAARVACSPGVVEEEILAMRGNNDLIQPLEILIPDLFQEQTGNAF